MSIPVPLTVRIKTATSDRHVTADLRSLSFRSVAPGGFASASFSFDRPLALQPEDVAYYAPVWIYDERNGNTVWEGGLEDPGRSVGNDGQVWDVTAIGPSGHPANRYVARVYVDGSNERWRRSPLSSKNGRVESTTLDGDDDAPAMLLIFPEGMTIAQNYRVDMQYRTLYDCGQKLARVRADYDNAFTSNLYENQIVTRVGPNGAGSIVTIFDWSSGGPLPLIAATGSPINPIPAGHDVANIRIERESAGSEVATENRWGEMSGISVRALLKDVNGNDITTDGYYTSPSVLAHEVIRDLIGRGDLSKFDAATAVIATNTNTISQMAYPSGVSCEEILNELMTFEPAYFWAAWESLANGKHRFEWKAWPTTVRYEAEVSDGYSAAASGDGIYNEALVAYTDWRGRERTVRRTSTVPELTAAGITRTIHIDLGSEVNAQANAVLAGDQALLEHAVPSNAGTLTVARPVLDAVKGRMVEPWELRPGELIRVRGIRPSINSLNATARDGVTVFRIVGVEFDATDSAAARLELDSYPHTVARALAKLQKRRARRR